MPDIRLKHQPFDITFHPSEPIIYVGLLTGQVDAFKYSADKPDTEFEYLQLFSLRPTKRSCRGLATNFSGDKLYSVTKGKAIFTIDTATGQILETTGNAHESPINRVTLTFPNILATGDDEGVVKLWDERKKDEIRAYTHHFDFISDFLWLEDKRQLVATSGDGTLSVMDIRSNKGGPLVQSEDQDDELLSIAAIKNNMKAVVGTQLGNISIFNRNIGWGDCVDRIPGHPHSVETIYTLPPNLCPGTDIIATGSSDGMVRLVQILPTKVLGVIADHEEFPVERIKGDMRGSMSWIGSISHEKVLRLTDIGDALEESDNEDGGGQSENEDGDAVGGGKD
ncbi:WD40 repeat-like protein, partial [Cantharellus anzutake]|uniref:WD40 repeat-like protein n=1 Tax=Cantharellus anzutake TaxID=1750568 RepID=UPI001908EC01